MLANGKFFRQGSFEEVFNSNDELVRGFYDYNFIREPATGESDLKEAVRTAIINKRAGGTGLISGRKAFQRSFEEGIKLLHAIQDVYLENAITIA